MDETLAPKQTGGIFHRLGLFFKPVPLLGYLLGFMACVLWEQLAGEALTSVLGLPKMPVLFGLLTIFKVLAGVINFLIKGDAFNWATLVQIPAALVYLSVIYLIPLTLVARAVVRPANALARFLQGFPLIVTAVVQLALMYAVLHVWAEMSDYRLIFLKLTLIAVLFTLSLNIINGYMGEFSCSHPGFMAIGAYMSSLFTVGLFASDKVLGDAVFNFSAAYLSFPLALIFGGLMASAGALIVAIPSFKTRGDYLAIISLAFLFIVKSFFENMQVLGGSRGISGQPDWATLPVIFITMALRDLDDQQLRHVHHGQSPQRSARRRIGGRSHDRGHPQNQDDGLFVRRFLGWCGRRLAGPRAALCQSGHVQCPETGRSAGHGLFRGLNSVYGSIVGAVSISLLGEALATPGNPQVDRYSAVAHSGDDLSAHRPHRLQGVRCPAGVRTQGGGLICRFFTSPT
jgi:branched-chain amino acid transport system permease protein